MASFLHSIFKAPIPLENEVRSQKCYYANKRLSITSIRILTLIKKLLRKGPCHLERAHGPEIAVLAWQGPGRDNPSELKKRRKLFPPTQSWFCVLGKIS